MKLFKFSNNCAVVLDEVQFVRKCSWYSSKKESCCPCIDVTIKGKRYATEVRYNEGYEYNRDKDYDNLMKALEES